MLLAADIGNTTVSFGVFSGNELVFSKKISSEKQADYSHYLFKINEILSEYKEINKCIISSVVPELTDKIALAVKTVTAIEPIFAGAENHCGFNTDILPVCEIGSDLVAASVGATEKYGVPCLVADLGTATKILVIDKDKKFLGCTIAPGMKISLDALFNGASLLSETELSKPQRHVGRNTTECIQSGVVNGTAAMIDGMFRRITKETQFQNPFLIVTGGNGKFVADCFEEKIIFDENLVLYGLKAIAEGS